MTSEEVKEKIALIYQRAEDSADGAAHEMQDALMLEVLKSIAEVTCLDPVTLAKECLKVTDVIFCRWYQ